MQEQSQLAARQFGRVFQTMHRGAEAFRALKRRSPVPPAYAGAEFHVKVAFFDGYLEF